MAEHSVRIENDEKQAQLLKSRLEELAERSYSSNIFTFTDFLNMQELSDALSLREIDYASPRSFGGADFCERRMIRFGDEESLGYSVEYPISVIKARPLSGSFSRELSHRDFLGSLMNLGIERSCIGDIFVKDNIGYIFCVSRMADFISENLKKAARENLECTVLETCELPSDISPKFEPKTCSVASLRVDAVISAVFNISRSDSLDAVKGGCVFVNQRECTSPSKELAVGDTVSVRGSGKFIYRGVNYLSRKGKSNISIDLYA